MHRYYTKHAMDLLEEPLEEANLKDIVNDLEKVAKDWMKIGLQLSLKPDKLEKIDSEQKESSDKLLKMLVQWLRVEKHPTRMAIVKALESNSVGVTRLAHKLREEYTSNKVSMKGGGYATTILIFVLIIAHKKLIQTQFRFWDPPSANLR